MKKMSRKSKESMYERLYTICFAFFCGTLSTGDPGIFGFVSLGLAILFLILFGMNNKDEEESK